MSTKLNKLIASDINFEIIFDSSYGVSVALGDEDVGWEWDGTYETLDEAVNELWKAAKLQHPYAKCFKDARHLSPYH